MKFQKISVIALTLIGSLLTSSSAFAVQEINTIEQLNDYFEEIDPIGETDIVSNITLSEDLIFGGSLNDPSGELDSIGKSYLGNLGDASTPVTFDGAGFTISGLVRPLFNVINENSEVKNLTLVTEEKNGLVAQFTSSTHDYNPFYGGSQDLGVLAAENRGTVDGVEVSGDIDGGGIQHVGGLVGQNVGTIKNSTSNVNVENSGDPDFLEGLFTGGIAGVSNGGKIEDSSATGHITGDIYVGGLVGWAWNGVVISKSSTSGEVSGQQIVGGLVGSASQTTVDRSFANGNISGEVNVGGLFGELTYSSTVSDAHYSEGVIVGDLNVGGVVGIMQNSTIFSTYFSGTVTPAFDSTIGTFAGISDSNTLSHIAASGGLTDTVDDQDNLFGTTSNSFLSNFASVTTLSETVLNTILILTNWSTSTEPLINEGLPYLTELRCRYIDCNPTTNNVNSVPTRLILTKKNNVEILETKNFVLESSEISTDCCFNILSPINSKLSNLSNTDINQAEIDSGYPLELYLDLGERIQIKIETAHNVDLEVWIETDNCESVFLGMITIKNQELLDQQIAVLPPLEFLAKGEYKLKFFKIDVNANSKSNSKELFTHISIWVQ